MIVELFVTSTVLMNFYCTDFQPPPRDDFEPGFVCTFSYQCRPACCSPVITHQAVASDFDVAALSLEFHELAARVELASMSLPDALKCLTKSDGDGFISNTDNKPHSADVERCISANSWLKTSLRSACNEH